MSDIDTDSAAAAVPHSQVSLASAQLFPHTALHAAHTASPVTVRMHGTNGEKYQVIFGGFMK